MIQAGLRRWFAEPLGSYIPSIIVGRKPHTLALKSGIMPVTKEKFTEICKEHNYPDDIIEHLWRTRSSDANDLSEKAIRKITEEMAPQISDLVRFIEEIMEMGIEGG